MIKAGLDPKFFKKKRGLLGKIGTGIKWGIIGAIGAAISGLIYLFKEEIVKLGKSIVDGFESVKEGIQIIGDFFTSTFETIKKSLESFAKMIMESPIGGYVKRMGDWFKEKMGGENSLVKIVENY